MKYETICDVAAAFKSGELDNQTHVMMIDNDESVLIRKGTDDDPEDYDAWENPLWEGEAPLNVTAATCDTLGIPHEGV